MRDSAQQPDHKQAANKPHRSCSACASRSASWSSSSSILRVCADAACFVWPAFSVRYCERKQQQRRAASEVSPSSLAIGHDASTTNSVG